MATTTDTPIRHKFNARYKSNQETTKLSLETYIQLNDHKTIL